MPDYVRTYRTGHVYIMDDCDVEESDQSTRSSRRIRRHTIHSQKVQQAAKFFTDFTEYKVHSVKFSRETTVAQFHDYFKEELATKTEKDLIIIYYDGISGFTGPDWTWSFEGDFKGPVNAFDLIKRICQSKCDCLVFADCNMPTRFRKWRRKTGTTEIINCGAILTDSRGRPLDDVGDFTDRMFNILADYVEDIEKVAHLYPRLSSVCQLMSWDKKLTSNPVHVFLSRPSKGGKKVIRRFVIDAENVKQTGMLKFFAKQIQGDPTSDLTKILPVRPVEVESELDEGYYMGFETPMTTSIEDKESIKDSVTDSFEKLFEPEIARPLTPPEVVYID